MANDKPDDQRPETGAPKRLILMRHAKSDWSDASLSDHARPLNRRGRRSAPLMADWLSDIGSIPDVILSSTSERTKETVQLMLPTWNRDPVVSYSDALYLASPQLILKTIRSDACDATTLMAVAHNPGIAMLVSALAERSIEMPTAAVAVFDVLVDNWHSLRGAPDVRLVEHMRPKALK
jgi:phosphohistidine phosphatase